MLYTYAFYLFSWEVRVITKEEKINRIPELQKDYISLDWWFSVISTKSIAEIKLVVSHSELVEIAKKTDIDFRALGHLRPWNKPLDYNQLVLWQKQKEKLNR